MKRKPALSLLLFCLCAGFSAFSQDKASESYFSPPNTDLFLPGRFVFEKNCATCHGRWGDGKGDMSMGMLPRPRSFVSGVFKYHSTPSGFLPTNDDLMRTIREGVPGTAMPSFTTLSENEIRAVTEYIKTFSSKWRKKENFAAPLQLPSPPAWFENKQQSQSHAASGKQLFSTVCASCHGQNGDGHGPAAPQLKDQWDQPCPPSDLRQPVLRAGRQFTDLYRVLLTGISGTPMPSFADSLSEEQRWDLLAYIRDLRREFHPD